MITTETTIGSLLKPRREKAIPAEHPDLYYVGLEHIEAHTTKLLGSVPATEMKSTANRFFSGDVLYSRLRPYLNKVWHADRDGLCSPEFIVMPGNESLDANFLRYRLNSADFVSFANSLNAGDRPRVDFDQISVFQTWLPKSLKEQRRIVAEIEKQFTRLEAGVAALRRVQANLKRYRAAVLKAACEGKLVPTEAELHRQKRIGKGIEPPTQGFETGAQLLKRILAERRQHWDESNRKSKIGNRKYVEPAAPDLSAVASAKTGTANLPPLPAGWTWATMPQLGELNRGKSKHRPRDEARLYGGPYPFIQTGDVRKSGGTIREHHQTYSEFGLQQSRLWPEGTLCITIAANIAETGILKFKSCFPDSIVGFTHDGNPATTRYVEFFIRTAKEKLAQFAPATAQKNINLDVLQKVAVPLPPLAEQTRIVAEVERRLSVVEELESVVSANLQRATRLRQSILQKAFTGELVVSETTNVQLGLAGIPSNIIDIEGILKNRAALDAYILANSPFDKNLGRTKMEKENHFTEFDCGVDLRREPVRDAAGPVDLSSRLAVEEEAKRQDWYSVVKHQMAGGKTRYEYIAGKNIAAAIPVAEKFMGDRKQAVDRLIKLLKSLNTDQCSIAATLYAAWNDLLLLRRPISDQAVIKESSINWHREKQKILLSDWNWGLNWLRKNNIIPQGRGKPVPPKNN